MTQVINDSDINKKNCTIKMTVSHPTPHFILGNYQIIKQMSKDKIENNKNHKKNLSLSKTCSKGSTPFTQNL